MYLITNTSYKVYMKNIELAAVQERFADIVWENEPIASGDLVQICEKKLNWKLQMVHNEYVP